jgi:inner membrane protein
MVAFVEGGSMTLVETLKYSVVGKVLFIGALILTLLIPLGMIEDLTTERAQRYESARADVARAWGEAQTIGGPILVVPFRFTKLSYAQPVTASDELYLLADELEIASEAQVEKLKRGIYEVPVYSARVRLSGRFTPPDLNADYDDLEILWSQAQIALPISDARSIKEPVRFTSDGASATFQPGGTRVAGFGPQLVARYAELGRGAPSAPLAFSLDVTLGGSSSLRFLPLGAVTRATMTANWPSPSFGGAYLPERRAVTAAGFTASWRVLDVGRSFGSAWKRSDTPPSVDATSFGAALIMPIGVHEGVLRTTKYGVLLIALSFAAYFLFELLAPLRLHTLQYLLIGIANCVFYLLLLALAEHIGFRWAYSASAIAATALIGTYSAAVLRSMRRAVPIGALLGTLYAYLYVTLRAEDYALLFGAVGTFAALATFMYVTRRVDWHHPRFGSRAPGAGDERPPPGPQVQLHA